MGSCLSLGSRSDRSGHHQPHPQVSTHGDDDVNTAALNNPSPSQCPVICSVANKSSGNFSQQEEQEQNREFRPGAANNVISSNNRKLTTTSCSNWTTPSKNNIHICSATEGKSTPARGESDVVSSGSGSVLKGLVALTRTESLKNKSHHPSATLISSNEFCSHNSSSISVENNNSIIMSGGLGTHLEVLYCNYSDGRDAIEAIGCSRLCDDLSLPPDSFQILLLGWRMGASVMCRITRSEFMTGFSSFGADSLSSLRRGLSILEGRVGNESELFKEVYRWAYGYGLEPGERILQIDMAKLLWKCVFGSSTYMERVGAWLSYLDSLNGPATITRDTWNMFLVFVTIVLPDLTNYNEEEAWPTLFDDFVEYELRRRKAESSAAAAASSRRDQEVLQ